MSWLKHLPKWILIVGGVFILLIIISGTLWLRKDPPPAATTNTINPSSGSSDIRLGNPDVVDTIPLYNDSASRAQDAISRIKADRAYQKPRTDLPYAELFRNAESYKGQFARYSGNVIQVMGEPGYWNLRVNITRKGSAPYTYWEDTVFIYSYSPERVIEKDIIEFTALLDGTTTYKSTLGGDITIPSLIIVEHTLSGRSD